MKALLLLSIGLSLHHAASAQIDFRKGFVITHEKDTLAGLINFHDAGKAYETCEFRRTPDTETRNYSPGDIFGYGFVDSRRFLSKAKSDKDDKEVVFMELLAAGRIDLYRYRDTYWIQKEGDSLKQLRDEQIEKKINGDTYRTHSNEHIATLNMLMSDCREVTSMIQKIPLYQRELVRLVETYNRCGNKKDVQRADNPWIKVIPGLIGGVQLSEMDMNDMNTLFSGEITQTQKTVSPTIGLSLDVSAPRVSERFVFTTSLLYNSSKYYLSSGANKSLTHYVVVDVDALKVPFGIRYTFAPRKVTPFLNVGVSTTFHISDETSWTIESISGSEMTTFDKGPLPVKSNQIGFWGGIGIFTRIGKKLDTSIELRYERTDGIVHMAFVREYSSDVTNLQLLIGVRLNQVR